MIKYVTRQSTSVIKLGVVDLDIICTCIEPFKRRAGMNGFGLLVLASYNVINSYM